MAVVGLLKVGYSVLREARSTRQEPCNEQSASNSIDALYSQAHTFFVRLASQFFTVWSRLQ